MFHKDIRQVFFSFILVFCLLASCNAKPSTAPTNEPSATSVIKATSTYMPTITFTPLPTATTLSFNNTEDLVKGFADAWVSQDPNKILSFYSKDIKAYDAGAYGEVYSYADVNSFLKSYVQYGAITLDIYSYFVSDDDQLVALLGIWTEKSSSVSPITPVVSLIELKEGLVIWEYDYYGGSWSDVYPLPDVSATLNMPTGSTDQVIAETKAMLTDWETAYNNRDSQTFISYYSDQTTCTYIISPEWKILSKDRLKEVIDSTFNDTAIDTSLDNFFISKDGHYAAVQGMYIDANSIHKPMIILLRIDNSRIVEQYVYAKNSLGMIDK